MTAPRLTPEQQRRVERGTGMVDRLARSMVHRLSGVSEDELRSVGYEAMVGCSLRYDPAQGIPFRTFCNYRVRGAMIDAARRAMPAVRRRSRAMRTMVATQALLEQAQTQQPGPGPDPRTLRERVEAAAELIKQATAAVVLAHAGGADPERVIDPVRGDPERALDDVRTRAHVRRAIARCTEDEQAILRGLYDEGLSMTELGQRLGRNKSTISRRHAALLRRLSEQLREVGPGGLDP